MTMKMKRESLPLNMCFPVDRRLSRRGPRIRLGPASAHFGEQSSSSTELTRSQRVAWEHPTWILYEYVWVARTAAELVGHHHHAISILQLMHHGDLFQIFCDRQLESRLLERKRASLENFRGDMQQTSVDRAENLPRGDRLRRVCLAKSPW